MPSFVPVHHSTRLRPGRATEEHYGAVARVLDADSVTDALREAGCVAAADEASELLRCAEQGGDLEAMVARRQSGEPLAWITGHTTFCGIDILMDAGVFVPRWQSESLATRAALLVGAWGTAIDLCTGSGAIAKVLQSARPRATIVATELDPAAARCARRNGVTVYQGDLDEPLPRALKGTIDVMCGVLPYVPTEGLHLLPRDVLEFEPRRSLDGGPGGLKQLARAVARSVTWTRGGGWLLLEAGSDQVGGLADLMETSGYVDLDVIRDADDDPRGMAGRLAR